MFALTYASVAKQTTEGGKAKTKGKFRHSVNGCILHEVQKDENVMKLGDVNTTAGGKKRATLLYDFRVGRQK